MRKSILGFSAVLSTMLVAAPAMAQDAEVEPVKITGNVALVSDYRFRGITQNSENAAVQGGITATSSTGLYVGTWASSVNFGTLGETEVDLFAGYSKEVTPGVTLDVGLLYYLYPNKTSVNTDYFEPYVNVSGTIGPVSAKVGANYAWKQSAIGDYSSVYLHTEWSLPIPNTPLGLNAHGGYAKSDSFLGGTDGDYFDYSVGATATYKMLTFGVSYVNTDIKAAKEPLGADGAVVFSIGASF
ncbi:TorF family putative porin [Sphingobium sp. H39-3-25]|uniref:TorF family putative porin n=1 Tax=Sphingobium arseniciresistens TaxID=3030834 RepID=UPI0023BA32CC|nr:TorF family putative porin [Sphingobium arseniciresistens]